MILVTSDAWERHRGVRDVACSRTAWLGFAGVHSKGWNCAGSQHWTDEPSPLEEVSQPPPLLSELGVGRGSKSIMGRCYFTCLRSFLFLIAPIHILAAM